MSRREADAAAFAAGQAGALAAAADAAATDQAIAGMDAFRAAAENLANVGIAQKKGNLFEYIEAAKFNAEAARQGVDARAVVTADAGRPHDPADIELVTAMGRVIKRVQAKVSSNPRGGFYRDAIRNEKYDGMEIQVPSDHVDQVRGPTDQLTGSLAHGDADSGGTSLDELLLASDHPLLYSLMLELKNVSHEVVTTAGTAAVSGGVMGVALSAVRQGWAVHKGEQSVRQAATQVARDGATAAGRSAAVGVVGGGLRYAASKGGLATFTQSNVATASAAALIEVGTTVHAYARGELSGAEAAERIGRTGTSTVSGLYAGAAAGMLLGPVGAVAGSIVGYMLAGAVFQSSLAVLREAPLAEAEAARVVALSEASIAALGLERRRIEVALETGLRDRRESFDALLQGLDESLLADDAGASVRALQALSWEVGRELKLVDFEDFDRFMTEEDGPLVF